MQRVLGSNATAKKFHTSSYSCFLHGLQLQVTVCLPACTCLTKGYLSKRQDFWLHAGTHLPMMPVQPVEDGHPCPGGTHVHICQDMTDAFVSKAQVRVNYCTACQTFPFARLQRLAKSKTVSGCSSHCASINAARLAISAVYWLTAQAEPVHKSFAAKLWQTACTDEKLALCF